MLDDGVDGGCLQLDDVGLRVGRLELGAQLVAAREVRRKLDDVDALVFERSAQLVGAVGRRGREDRCGPADRLGSFAILLRDTDSSPAMSWSRRPRIRPGHRCSWSSKTGESMNKGQVRFSSEAGP